MHDIYDGFDAADRSPAEDRLSHDFVFGCLDYPDNPDNADDYFRAGLLSIITVNEPQKVLKVLTTYLRYATEPGLRSDLESAIHKVKRKVAKRKVGTKQ